MITRSVQQVMQERNVPYDLQRMVCGYFRCSLLIVLLVRPAEDGVRLLQVQSINSTVSTTCRGWCVATSGAVY
jgi:hypothetical protein